MQTHYPHLDPSWRHPDAAPPAPMAARKTFAVNHHGRVTAVALVEGETLAHELGKQYTIPAATSVAVGDPLPEGAEPLT